MGAKHKETRVLKEPTVPKVQRVESKTRQTMSYRPCRWYDPYPRLAFAFKLLRLAPQQVRQMVLEEFALFMDLHWGEVAKDQWVLPPHNRWYDLSDDVSRSLERIRHGNDHLKEVSADQLLSALKQAA